MSKRGPAPRPSAQKRARGERSDRLNPFEPTPSPRPPRCPRSLCAQARRVWRRLAPDLYRAGVLSHWDIDAFATYCDLVVQVERARHLLEVGLLVKGRRDPLVTSPALRTYRDLVKLLLSFAQAFGLTPSSRSAIVVRPLGEAPLVDAQPEAEDEE